MRERKILFFVYLVLGVLCHPLQVLAENDVSQMKELYSQGISAMQDGRYNEAIESFQEVLKINPKLAAVHNLLGMAYLQQNESPSSAVDAFLMAIKSDPQFADAYFNLATFYMGEGDNRELAYEYFKDTLKADPKHTRAYFGLGWLELQDRGHPEEAVKMFLKVTELTPEFAEGHFGLGLAYLRLNDRVNVLMPISMLRSLGRDDLALRIEDVLRGDVNPAPLPSEELVPAVPGLAPLAPSDPNTLPPSSFPLPEIKDKNSNQFY